MPDHFEKLVVRTPTRIKQFGFRSQISEDDVDEVVEVEAVEAVEFVATSWDEDENEIPGVSAVAAVEAVEGVAAHIHTSCNFMMNFHVLDQFGNQVAEVNKEFSQYLTEGEKNQLELILNRGFQRAKDSIT